jgi:uncharacterized protein with GYD domain
MQYAKRVESGIDIAHAGGMITFIMLTRIAPDFVRSPRTLEDIERATMDRIRSACPSVAWGKSYAALGRYDYVDVFQAPDVETAMRVAVLVRAHGHADTEIWPVVEWDAFRRSVLSNSERELLLDAP